MKRIFADTSFYVALIETRDRYHHKAVDYFKTSPAMVVTTEFVLLEIANFFSRANAKVAICEFIDQYRANPMAVIIPATKEWLAFGWSLYTSRRDKDWSLTDCISFEVMKRQSLTDALTADHHFAQARYRALLLE